ncbi:hypothetical protein CG723_09005 [Streptomyces sp. CB01635]|uniref:hypothetical protein n=1 Tax=unclassified Streptomyces TaxID=2593676 RepID=UPI000C27E793|nr:hypothetical protein [Streptomyces sp. CB01635]PJN11098.1 hypothetical protein CG723_09005 [Streptomyces sp. CB01635]
MGNLDAKDIDVAQLLTDVRGVPMRPVEGGDAMPLRGRAATAQPRLAGLRIPRMRMTSSSSQAPSFGFGKDKSQDDGALLLSTGAPHEA